MGAVHMAVHVENQFSSVAMRLPLGNDLHIDSFLDRARDKHSPQRSLAESRKAEPHASSCERFFRREL